jgi:predicted CoA-binding protein
MNVARIPAPNVPEPGATEGPSRQDLLRNFERRATIAAVGTSANEGKAAQGMPSFVQSQGYQISTWLL